MHCVMSLEGGKICGVALLYEPGKTGRGIIYEKPFRVILSSLHKNVSLGELEINVRQSYFRLKIDFLSFTLFLLHFLYTLRKAPTLIS